MVFKRLLICSFFRETDLLTLTPHTPTPEPVRYDKKDGQWYTHDGVDVKDTQSRKGMFSTDNFQNYFSNFNLPLNFYKNNIGASAANENMGLLLVLLLVLKSPSVVLILVNLIWISFRDGDGCRQSTSIKCQQLHRD